ncbi:hypothetical protein [Primorskyibacter sp. S87]|uniref:hypothetical protein n=1 Tax=Primorskyibacter sp. S87 TaxID=3415126 RepID=UPI003C7B1BC9
MTGLISRITLMAAGFLGTALSAEEVTFRTSPIVTIGEHEVPVELALSLKDVSATRIYIESVVDLRRAQDTLVNALTADPYVDICNARITVSQAIARTDDIALTLGGKIDARLYRCEGQVGDGRNRVEEVFAGGLTVGASASAEFKDDCLYFRLIDLRLTPDRLTEMSEVKEAVEEVRDIFFKATDAVLENNPVCPVLPAELSSLSPTYDAGGTRELGEGGIGLFFEGSVDASTEAIVDILQVLQKKEVLPPPPN